MQQSLLRIKREMERFDNSTLPGISCWQTDIIDELRASIVGPDDTPYENGVFEILIKIPERYPFVPPTVRVITPVYHPNIDDSGRICLDTLKLPPHGSWKPCLNLTSILIGIQLLLAEPNFDDALMSEIASEFHKNKEKFLHNAKEFTDKYAKKNFNSSAHSACGIEKNASLNISKKNSSDTGNEPKSKKQCIEI